MHMWYSLLSSFVSLADSSGVLLHIYKNMLKTNAMYTSFCISNLLFKNYPIPNLPTSCHYVYFKLLFVCAPYPLKHTFCLSNSPNL